MRSGLGLSGVPFDDVLMPEVLQRIGEFIEEGGTHQLATANIDYLAKAAGDTEYRRILCMCDLVMADGMPIVWASRLFGVPLRERVAGADLVPQFARMAGLRGYSIFLLGATPEVLEAAARHMEKLSPGVRIVGKVSPPICALDAFENEPILDEIARARPDILLVAFGSPKQEKWISRNRQRLSVPVCIGIGASLDFLAGTVRRAPAWMQHSSLEWLYRVWTEPQRLAPRYFGDAVWMTRYLTVQVAVHFRGRRREHLRVSLDSIGSVAIVSVSGAMAGSGLTALENVLSTGLDCGGSVVLDLTETTHMGADGLWTMVGLLRRAVNRGCEVCLCGLSPSLRRTLKAANFEGLFRSAISSLEAVRLISPGRLQISLDLGDGWALCRIRGDLPVGGRATLEDICHGLRRAHANVVFDTSGAAGFDPAILAWPAALIRPVKYVDGRAPRVQGAA